MAKEAKKATKLEKKLRILLGGYSVRKRVTLNACPVILMFVLLTIGQSSSTLQTAAGHT